MFSLPVNDPMNCSERSRAGQPSDTPTPLKAGFLARSVALVRHELASAWREPLLRNGHFLTMSSVATAVVGLLYWSLAAHRYSTTVVGRSSAVVAAMMLIGGMAQMNLVSALVRFVPVAGARTKHLVVTSYVTAAAVACVLGVGFIAIAPALSDQFRFVTAQPWMAVGLVVSCALWAVFVLQDSVLTGLRQAILVAAENAVFSVIKVIAVVALATITLRDGILVSWWIGLVVAVVGTNLYLFRRAIPRHSLATEADMTPLSVRSVARFAGPDYVGGFSWLALTTATPLIVLASVGATETAYFTIAWQFGIALLALSANMGTSLMVETANDQSNLAERWLRVVRHSILPLGMAVVVLEVGAPWILRVFGPAYSAHASDLLRLLALAALPNLITETAAFAARSQQRTATAAAILTSVSVGTLGLMLLLLPLLGIVAVGIACVAVETVVAAVLLIRPHWWIKDWTPLPATAGLRARLSVSPRPSDEMALLGTTIGLMLVGAITLSIGLIHRDTSVVLASLLSTGLALVPLALFHRKGQQPRRPVGGPPVGSPPLGSRPLGSRPLGSRPLGNGSDAVEDPVDVVSLPIEGYDELRVDEILPLLQELDADRLDVVRAHEASRESRPSILARIDLLTASEEAVVLATEPPFPIANYDQLRVVDIVPLLAGLDAEALDAVLAREEAGAGRTTLISRIGRLRKRAGGAAMAVGTPASAQEG
jgi:O-antigen/teichoic acid export membrane protein